MTENHPVLPPADVASLLAAMAAEVEAEVGALPDSLARWHPAPTEWYVNEVLGHLIESERRGFNSRIRLILSADEPRLPGWNQVEVARARADCQQPTVKVLAEFLALRRDSVGLVRGLSAADLQRGGDHEVVGYLRVADLLQEWVHHDRNHVRQLLANVQLAVWPHLGNSQKFAGE